jgi:hypothetical protein
MSRDVFVKIYMMKKLELNKMGVQEMNTTEMLNTQGGSLLDFLTGLLGGVNTLLTNVVTTLNKVLSPLINIGIGPL